MNNIYLDHAATTPVHPRVAGKIVSFLTETYGNPSSIHSFGREARRMLDEARSEIVTSINAQFTEIVFTSGGTEADNLAIIGTARANSRKGKHIITTMIEHHAVLHACKYLEREGFEVTFLEPDARGLIDVNDVKDSLRADTILVTIMYGNNEVGTIQPIKEIGALLEGHQAYFHTDAVQAYGMEKIDIKELQVDLMSTSAHKINGPKGIGFLYVKTGTKIAPATYGGGQELKMRAGTENLSSIIGFAEAVIISQEALVERNNLFKQMKEAFLQVLETEEIRFSVNGSVEHSLSHILNLSFPGTDVEVMLVNLDIAGIAASSGSACTAGAIDPSHVLVAMFGIDSERIRDSVRFSFGLGNTLVSVDKAARETAKIARRLQI